jgi:transposase InsO family protein
VGNPHRRRDRPRAETHRADLETVPRHAGTRARTIIATDFFHVDTVLLTRIYAPVFIEHHTRPLHVAGITANPDGARTAPQARNLAMTTGTRLEDMRFPIRDRGSQFTGQFDAVFESRGLRMPKSPPQAPRANATCERLIGTLRRELFDRIPILNQAHLRAILAEYATRSNSTRPHQGIAQHVPDDDLDHLLAAIIDLDTARIRRKPILGNLISEYHVAA